MGARRLEGPEKLKFPAWPPLGAAGCMDEPPTVEASPECSLLGLVGHGVGPALSDNVLPSFHEPQTWIGGHGRDPAR